jgi:signal transduction histidine kinase
MAQDQLIRAVHLATRKLASTGSYDSLLRDVLAICVEAVGAAGGTIYLHDPVHDRLRFQHVLPPEVREKLPMADMPDTFGMAGEAFQSRRTVRRDFPERPESERNPFEQATGVVVHSMLCSPLMMESEEPIGVVAIINKRQGVFDEADVNVIETVGAVATMAYQNSLLLQQASRAASLVGMGKVSHDIGNLAATLFANLSFTDMLMDKLRQDLGRPASAEASLRLAVEELEPVFEDLKASVDRIVRYSRLMSELSAGQPLRPDFVLAPLAPVVRSTVETMESEGRAHHIAIRAEIDDDAPPTRHDALYISRIVQNLVGNAIKAIRETSPLGESDGLRVDGEITVRYRFQDDWHWIDVTDTGPGMAPETVETILSGNARSQWDRGTGSGWGTKIVLELAAAHEGRLEIDSVPGVGTTFSVALPARVA